MKKIWLLLAMALYLSIPVSVDASEAEVLSEEFEKANYYVYTLEDAYLSLNADGTDIVGLIKADQRMYAFEENSNFYKVVYANTQGYVSKSLITTESSVKDAIDSNGYQVTEDEYYAYEKLYPYTHYFPTFNIEAAIALCDFTSDGDYSNDYVILYTNEDINIPGFVISTAYLNGCDTIGIYYAADQMSVDIMLNITTYNCDNADEYKIAFSYLENKVELDTGDFPREIKAVFSGTKFANILKDGNAVKKDNAGNYSAPVDGTAVFMLYDEEIDVTAVNDNSEADELNAENVTGNNKTANDIVTTCGGLVLIIILLAVIIWKIIEGKINDAIR